MHKPLVSIIVPCYNQAQYLEEALSSVFNQTHDNWECIIVNDGSPDDTHKIAQEWLLKDSRFKYISQENGGLSSARNAGITISQGEFILPLDADDKIDLKYTELALKAFAEDPSLKVVYCEAEKFGLEKGIWSLSDFSLDRLSRENMIFCSAFFRKNDWKSVGGYDINLIYGLEDWEFWIYLLKTGGNVKRLNHVGFFYRIKENSMINQMGNQRKKEMITYINIKHADFFIEKLGTFLELIETVDKNKKQYQNTLKSKKFVIDLFCSTFLGFSVFGFYNNKKK